MNATTSAEDASLTEGAEFVGKLAAGCDGQGYSPRNLRYFRGFFLAFADRRPVVADTVPENGTILVPNLPTACWTSRNGRVHSVLPGVRTGFDRTTTEFVTRLVTNPVEPSEVAR